MTDDQGREIAKADTPRRILIVEDDESHAELIRRGFARDGGPAQLQMVRTVREAHARILEAVPDLVITDLRLPDGDGAELIDSDRARARFPVVAMTSYGDQQVAVEAMRMGALDYVVKSATTLSQMPRTAQRALREWSHIVERRNAEAALERSERHFRSLIENALDLILVLDGDGRLGYTSPSVQRGLGWGPEALPGRLLLELVHSEDGDTARGAMERAWARPGEPQFAVVRIATSDERWRSYEIVGQVQSIGEADSLLVVNARDVTERLAAEEERGKLEAQLRESQRLETLGTLAGGIAHDFGNILQAILSCGELALRTDKADVSRNYLEIALQAARRGRDVVEQIMHFSRRHPRQLRRVELGEVVREVAGLLRAAGPVGLEIRERIEASGTVVADVSQIHQVLMNLATNARQAMGDVGTIEIALERGDVGRDQGDPAGRHLVLSVTDSGPGIPPEVRERIFEPFFTTKPLGEGTGLGLAVVHGIVEAHGGTILCDSEPGRGTTFRVNLTEARREPEAPQPATPTRSASRGRVLLVDDDADVRLVSRSLLESLGHHVTTAASGPEATRLIGADPDRFDLLVTDEAMPLMTGSQLCAEAQRLRPDLPVIIISGHGPPPEVLLSGAERITHLRKPFEADELAEAVAAALARGR